MEFSYVDMGQATMVGEDNREYPVEGSRIYGVKKKMARNSGLFSPVLGVVQSHPTLNEWRAVAAYSDGVFPAVKMGGGTWSMQPGRTGFKSRKEASVWLLGMHDARQAWVHDAYGAARDEAVA